VVVVDSSVWIDFFNGKKNESVRKFEEVLGKELVVVPDLIRIEVLQGFSNERDYGIAKDLLGGFLQAAILNETVTGKTIDNFRLLRRKGVTIRKTIDVIIGTFCSVHGYELLHCDSDFDLMGKHVDLKFV